MLETKTENTIKSLVGETKSLSFKHCVGCLLNNKSVGNWT